MDGEHGKNHTNIPEPENFNRITKHSAGVQTGVSLDMQGQVVDEKNFKKVTEDEEMSACEFGYPRCGRLEFHRWSNVATSNLCGDCQRKLLNPEQKEDVDMDGNAACGSSNAMVLY